MKSKKRKCRPEILTYLIPTCGVILLVVYNIVAICVDDISVIQNSTGFEKMLETIVTFISIVLSVFGFLIPAFLSSKGSSLLIQYFLDSINVEAFVKQLKNVVAVGLLDVIFTCVLLLGDIFSTDVMNILLEIWIWFILYFMCVAYRFISILLSIMIAPKEERKQEVINEASKEVTNNLRASIKKIQSDKH